MLIKIIFWQNAFETSFYGCFVSLSGQKKPRNFQKYCFLVLRSPLCCLLFLIILIIIPNNEYLLEKFGYAQKAKLRWILALPLTFYPPLSLLCASVTFLALLCLLLGIFVNPLSPKSDQHQISPCNINALLNRVVMRITDIITQDEFVWYFNHFSPLLL